VKITKQQLKQMIKEELDKLHAGAGDLESDTPRVLQQIGYNGFLNSLSAAEKQAFHNQLSHHLMGSLTVPMGFAELGDSERTLKALQNTHARLQRLLGLLALDTD
jgi:hypothetical protein